MKLLNDISLFSKYVGLKRESDALELNATVFRTLLEDGDFKNKLESLDEDLLFVHARLVESVDSHKKLFLEHAGVLLDGGKPNEEFLKLFLVVTQIVGGNIHMCMTYALDLLKVLKPESVEADLIEEVTNYTTDLAKDGYITPGGGLLGGDSSDVVALLSDKSKELVKPELDELRARLYKRNKASTEFDLLTMQPASTTLN